MDQSKLLANRIRQEILRMTAEKDMTVTEIAKRLSLTKATVSHHIKLLQNAGLIRVAGTEIAGNFVKKYYRSILGDITPINCAEEKLFSEFKRSLDHYSFLKLMVKSLGLTSIQTGHEIFLKKVGFDLGYHVLADMVDREDFQESLIKLWKKLEMGEITEFVKNRLTVEDCYFCKDLPYSGYTYCRQDEGIIEGILLRKFGERYRVNEKKCTGTGNEVCEFEIKNPLRNS